jgi:dethiobiotin synthetase
VDTTFVESFAFGCAEPEGLPALGVPGVFITATGTDAGKTYVAAHVIRYLRRHGHTVRALKPVITGYTTGTAASSDCATLLDALGRPVCRETLDGISPWRYRAALAPVTAAALENRNIDFEAIAAFTVGALRSSPAAFTVIEGLGGVMVPFDGEHTVLDLLSRCAVPAVVVTGTYLGALSHTLTALDVLAARGVAIASVIVNASAAATVTLEQTAAALAPFVSKFGTRLVRLRRDPTAAEIETMCAAILHGLR